jgi:phage-related protein
MARPYIKLIINIGGEQIIIARDSVYRLLAGGITGIESADLEAVISEYAAMDGGYIDAVRVPPRHISVLFAVDERKQTEELRKKLIAFFSPRKQGTLIVERANRSRKIRFYLSEQPEFIQDNIIEDRLHVRVNMICPDPYFEDVTPTTVNFMKPLPLLTFPFNSLAGVGITAGVLEITDTTTLVNNVDMPVGIICDITANGGTVTNPKIAMNGQYVRVIKTMAIGDTIQIDTNKGQKNIYFNGESQFIFDRKSIFFQLPVGENTIVISADAGIKDAKASFTYSFKYLGV